MNKRQYILHVTWAGGFYSRTRKFKNLQNALDKFLLECDMLTDTVTLTNAENNTLLADKTGYRHNTIKGQTATLLTVGGKYQKVTL